MKTKTIMVSLLAVGMLIILPTISALQSENKIVQGSNKQKLSDRSPPDNFTLLYIFVMSVFGFRFVRSEFWSSIAGWKGYEGYERPLIGLRAEWLAIRAVIWFRFWENFGEKAGW